MNGLGPFFVLLALSGGAAGVAFAEAVPAVVRAALFDASRPAEDVARDPARKPAELVAFAGIKPGDRVVDFIPGSGYFTRIFSGVVGPTGHVYAMVPQVAEALERPETAKIASFAAKHANTSIVINGSGAAKPADLIAFDKAIYAALKPGGVFIVVDHAAPAGSGTADTKTLHRIDPAVVLRDVEGAGFVFDGRSEVLTNPADPKTKIVFDPSIRGHTDQFAFKFRKPLA
jgi:predicted methyltransferase